MSYENVYVIGIFVYWFFIIGKNCRGSRRRCGFVITTVLFACFFILMVSVGITILVNYFLSGTVLAKYQARRSALVYQLENLNYSDQVATELLYEQIISFNEDVSTGKEMIYNPWLQWAVSGDYQYIDLIEYSNKGDSALK